jgi:hypothetical protein
MEYQNQNQQQSDVFNYQVQRPLPNATATLVLGILSIVLCFICGIIALAISGSDMNRYKAAPEMYTSSSYDLLKAGRTCAIIGICIFSAVILFYIIILIFAISIGSFNKY